MSTPIKASKIGVLAPIEIWEVMLDNRTIKFHQPLVIQPEILPPESEKDRIYFAVDIPDLNISVHADNREDLFEFVHSDIRFVWKRIVELPDAELDAQSLTIKSNYHAIAEAVDG